MATVYIEPHPKGRPEGDPIDDLCCRGPRRSRPGHLQDAARGNRVGEEEPPHRPRRERSDT